MKAAFVSVACLLFMCTSSDAQFEVFEEYLKNPSAAERKFQKYFREKRRELKSKLDEYRANQRGAEFQDDTEDTQFDDTGIPEIRPQEKESSDYSYDSETPSPQVAGPAQAGSQDAQQDNGEGQQPHSTDVVGSDEDALLQEYAYAYCSKDKTGFLSCESCDPVSRCRTPQLVYKGDPPSSRKERNKLICKVRMSAFQDSESRRTSTPFVEIISRCVEQRERAYRRRKKLYKQICFGRSRKCLEREAAHNRKAQKDADAADVWEFRIAKGKIKQAELDEIARQRAVEEAERQRRIQEAQYREQQRLAQIQKERELQEKKRRAEEAKRAWDTLRAKRDPSDVVAQVLNYTSTGKDEGTSHNFWIKERECVYRHISMFTLSQQANDLARLLQGGTTRDIIDLNSLDPRSLTFEEEEVWDGVRYAGVTTIVKYEGRPLLDNRFTTMLGGDPFMSSLFGQGSGRQNQERLQRGWTLIYSDYCSGTKKAF